MNLHRLLRGRAAAGRPVRVGLIGAGKFGAMFLAQARTTPGLHLMAVADLEPGRAREAFARTGWPDGACAAADFEAARKTGATHITDDAPALVAADGIEVVVEATGDPAAGLAHAGAAIAQGRHVVMVNVEADALAGPLLARRAAAAGVVYSLAYGDQPALICEQVDWARAAGFAVVCAGKGTRYQPAYHASTPETVWRHYGLSPDQAAAAGMNPRMFNSFLDGTKSALEMAAVANATGLVPGPDGLAFPPAGTSELANVLRPHSRGGTLAQAGTVEVVASERRGGAAITDNLRWGTFVVFEAPSEYVVRCFAEYGVVTDDSGRYAALWRPSHLIGLELGISIASAALRGEPTGAADDFRADVVAVAKRDLVAGEVLDGEGGCTVWGRLMRAADSLASGGLPIGLAKGARLLRPVPAGASLGWADVAVDETGEAFRTRQEMVELFAGGPAAAARA